jgi:hypothetical protein
MYTTRPCYDLSIVTSLRLVAQLHRQHLETGLLQRNGDPVSSNSRVSILPTSIPLCTLSLFE